MNELFELPIPEDVYDIDTFELKDYSEKIQKVNQKLEILASKDAQQLQWIKKSKKVLDLINLEIEERKAVENFGQFCQQDEHQFFQKLNDVSKVNDKISPQIHNNNTSNTQSNQNISQAYLYNLNNNSIKQMIVPNVQAWQEIQKSFCEQQHNYQFHNPTLPQIKDPNDLHDTQSFIDGEFHADTDSTASKDTNNPIGQKYLDQKKKIQTQMIQNKKSNQNFHDFMKKTLESTRITEPQMQFRVTQGTLGKFSSETSSSTNKKQSQRSSSSSRLENPQSEGASYNHVQSKVKSTIDQKNNKEQIYFMTGKPSVSSRYKPPKPKKQKTPEKRINKSAQQKRQFLNSQQSQKRSSTGQIKERRSQSQENLSVEKNNSGQLQKHKQIKSQLFEKIQEQEKKLVQSQVEGSKQVGAEIQKKSNTGMKNNNFVEETKQNEDHDHDHDEEGEEEYDEGEAEVNNQESQHSSMKYSSSKLEQPEKKKLTTVEDIEEDIEQQSLEKIDPKIINKNINSQSNNNNNKIISIQQQQQQPNNKQIQPQNNNEEQYIIQSQEKIEEDIQINKQKENIDEFDEINKINNNFKNVKSEKKIFFDTNENEIEDENDEWLDLNQKPDSQIIQNSNSKAQLDQMHANDDSENYKLDLLKNQILKKYKYNVSNSKIIQEEKFEDSDIYNILKESGLINFQEILKNKSQVSNSKLSQSDSDVQSETDREHFNKQLLNIIGKIDDKHLQKELQKKLLEMEEIKGEYKKLDEKKQNNNKITSVSTQIQPKIDENKLQKQQLLIQQQQQQQILQEQQQRQLELEREEQEQEEQKQLASQQQQMLQAKEKKKKIPPQPKAPSYTSKLLQKMMLEVKDEELIDYSNIIPSFNHLFSAYYNNIGSNNLNNFNIQDSMREIFLLFNQHVEKVDKQDKVLLKYRTGVTSLEISPSETYYMHDPRKVLVYANRVGIDMKSFVERQIILQQRLQNTLEENNQLMPHETFYYRVVRNKQEVYDIITRSFMRKVNWNELPHGMSLKTSWNLLWTWSKPQIDMNKLIYFQKVNHFTFNKNLARKDLLYKNLQRIQKLGQKTAQAFHILPTTFVLPKEYTNFSERFYDDMTREGTYNIWIMKPIGKSRGRGITLVNDISQVVYAEPMIVQKYLKNPYLIRGYKFDMRIYVLVTSFKPLEAFIFNEGFARMSTEQFTLDPQDIKNAYIHLTNFSIQKHNIDAQSEQNFIGGSKITLRMLRDQLISKGLSWNNIWQQVQEICVKALVACQQDIPFSPNCFEIFGYDIIIDTSEKCWLLEVNTSPSLAREFIIDDLIKQQLVDDAIELLDIPLVDRERLLEVLDRRIREEQGCKSSINTQNNSKLQLNRDLNYILRGKQIRKVGEMPQKMGGFSRIAPTEFSEKMIKMVYSYKVPSARNMEGGNHASID